MEDLLGRILGLIFLGLIAITRFLSRTLVGFFKGKPVLREGHRKEAEKRKHGSIFGDGDSESFAHKISKEFDDYDPGEFWYE